MDRVEAMIIALIFFVIFSILAYYGIRLTWWAAIVLGTLLFLVLLNVFYPPSQATNDSADYSLGLYVCLEILGLLVLGVYLVMALLTDVRC